MHKPIAALLSAIAFPTLAGDPADHPHLERRHVFILGGFFQEADAEIRATVDPLPEQAINLGHLGVDETDNTIYLEYRYHFAERWGLIAAAQKFSSEGTIGASRDFNFGGIEFPVGVELHSELDVDTYFLDVIYRAYQSPEAEFSVGLGIHAFDFDAQITGKAFAGDNEATATESTSDLLAPLPNLRLQGFYALSDRWSVLGSFGWMSANIDEWDGEFLYLHARTHYRLGDNWGIGLGYQYTDVDVTREKKRRETEYDMDFRGPTLQLTYAF